MKNASLDGRQSMRRNGRSFWFASLFLPPTVANAVAQLYAFCRTMDDLADESKTPEALTRLEMVRQDLRRGYSTDSQVANLLTLAKRYPLQLEVADHLIASFLADASTNLQLETETDLIRYCFGVAGTVGLLMAPILEASPVTSRLYAADLGIAMQMTNIARDVKEDAQNGRRYLPAAWIGGLTPRQIAGDPACRSNVADGICRLLDLADRFYASAYQGFPLIPGRSRRAIEVAATVYREIGVRLRRRAFVWYQERSVVPTSRKVILACAVFSGRSAIARLHSATASEETRYALQGLPGVS